MRRTDYDEPSGGAEVIVGGFGVTGTLHKYENGAQQSPKFHGPNDEVVKEKARQWFNANGGRKLYPNGLQLRLTGQPE